ISCSAFSTFQHGCALIFTKVPEQRRSFTAIALYGTPPLRRCEERELRFSLAAQERQVDLDTADAARLGERDRLRLQALRGEDAAARLLCRVGTDEAEVARQLLDRLDRADALDLDGDPLALLVPAHEVDGPHLGRPLAPDERELLPEGRRRCRE